MLSAGPVCSCAHFLVHITHETAGASAHPVFPAPLCPGNLSECANGRLRTNRPLLELSPLRPKAMDCFAALAMTGESVAARQFNTRLLSGLSSENVGTSISKRSPLSLTI